LVQSKGFIETFLANFGYEIIETQSLNDPSSYYHPTKSIIFKAENSRKIWTIKSFKTNLKQPTYVLN
jgi:hypothetical protein